VVGGAGNGVQWISVMTALQEATPPSLQARVTGLLESIGAAVPGVGFVLGGLLAAIGSPRTAYAVAGAGVLLLVAAALAGQAKLRSTSAPREPRRGAELPLPEALSPAPGFERDP
jgi:MFS family permease